MANEKARRGAGSTVARASVFGGRQVFPVEIVRDDLGLFANDALGAAIAPFREQSAELVDDFVGIQTYSRTRVGPGGSVGNEEGVEVLPMGYEFYPQSLANTLRRAWDYTGGQIPLVVTENGIGTDDDEQRIRYVQAALEGVLDCIDEGIDVRGAQLMGMQGWLVKSGRFRKEDLGRGIWPDRLLDSIGEIVSTTHEK